MEVRGEQSLPHARLRRACGKLCKCTDTIQSVVRLSAVVTTTRFLTVLVHGYVAIMSYMDNFSDISDEEFLRASQWWSKIMKSDVNAAGNVQTASTASTSTSSASVSSVLGGITININITAPPQ